MSDYSSESEEYYSGGSDYDSDEANSESSRDESGSYEPSYSGSSSESSRSSSPSPKPLADSSDFLSTLGRMFESTDSAPGDDSEEEESEPDEPQGPQTIYREYVQHSIVEEVVCLNCFNLPKDPVFLPCGHSICRECAKEAIELFKATLCFTQRYKVKDQEVGEDDEVLSCPVCMSSVVLKGGLKECKSDKHTEECADLLGKEENVFCGMCLSEFCAGVNCDVSKGVYECEICGPLCERHSHFVHVGHDHGKHKCDDKNHMRLFSCPHPCKRVKIKSKDFDLTNGCEGKIFFDEGGVPCDVYCETCKKLLSKSRYTERCARQSHKTISIEAAVEKLRKEKEEGVAKHESLEKEMRQKVSDTVDAIEDKLDAISTSRLVSLSLLEDGIYTTNMSEAKAKISAFYSLLRSAVDASEADLLKQLEEKDQELKDSLSKRCEAVRVLSETAGEATKAVKKGLDGSESDEFLLSLVRRLTTLEQDVSAASGLDQEAVDLTTLVKEKKQYTEEDVKGLLPSPLSIEGVASSKSRASAENVESSDSESGSDSEEGGDKSDGPLSIEDARKRVAETMSPDELKKIDSSMSFRSIIGSPLSSLDSSSGQDMFCAACFEILQKIKPGFDIDMIPILTESFCSLHTWDDIKTYDKVSKVVCELKAIALTLGMEI